MAMSEYTIYKLINFIYWRPEVSILKRHCIEIGVEQWVYSTPQCNDMTPNKALLTTVFANVFSIEGIIVFIELIQFY